jgi:hypothetical protein
MKDVAPIFSASAFFDSEWEMAVTLAPRALAKRRPKCPCEKIERQQIALLPVEPLPLAKDSVEEKGELTRPPMPMIPTSLAVVPAPYWTRGE